MGCFSCIFKESEWMMTREKMHADQPKPRAMNSTHHANTSLKLKSEQTLHTFNTPTGI